MSRETRIALAVIVPFLAVVAVVAWAFFGPKHYVNPHPTQAPSPTVVTVRPV